MENFYTDKIAFHQKQYQLAFDGNKDKAVAHHKKELDNYKEMLKIVKG
ncbi:MAG: hypothetical protein MJK15_04970 [Colwellia sp.]|nr:hypothetical protein [Colwellia sp.]